jgi:membrane protein DedA with SNARE-associated domain
MEWLHEFLAWLVEFVHELGYFGIFIMTFIESTFVPIPAEVTMLPAGYLVQQGKLNFWLVFLASVVGTVGGAYLNYWIARHYGRDLFLRYGKFFMMTPAKMAKLERFFYRHGAISTFTGRLIPGLRHYISFPAGLAKMRVTPFLTYTALGGSIWMMILLVLGYKIGENQHLAAQYMPWIKVGLLSVLLLGGAAYYWRMKRMKPGDDMHSAETADAANDEVR